MKITIKAENKEDEKSLEAKEVVYKDVVGFAMSITSLENKLVTKNYNHTMGDDIPYMIGRLEELKEILRRQ